MSPSEGLYLTGQHNTEKCRHTCMPRVGSESMIPVFKQSKTIHAFDCTHYHIKWCLYNNVTYWYGRLLIFFTWWHATQFIFRAVSGNLQQTINLGVPKS